MKRVFADTVYWVALINPNDEWRRPALAATSLLHDALLVTTDSILIEVLNFFAEHGMKVGSEQCLSSKSCS